MAVPCTGSLGRIVPGTRVLNPKNLLNTAVRGSLSSASSPIPARPQCPPRSPLPQVRWARSYRRYFCAVLLVSLEGNARHPLVPCRRRRIASSSLPCAKTPDDCNLAPVDAPLTLVYSSSRAQVFSSCDPGVDARRRVALCERSGNGRTVKADSATRESRGGFGLGHGGAKAER